MSPEAFTVSINGTSHGEGITTRITDCPEGILLAEDFIQQELDRRRPGQAFTTERQETDEFEFRSGVSPEGYTTSGQLEIFVPNRGQHSQAYDKLKGVLRPGHGITPQILKAKARGEDIETAGGGQASARLTIGNVAAGAVAQLAMDQLIPERDVEVLSYLELVGAIHANIKPEMELTEDMIYKSPIKCPSVLASKKMERVLEKVVKNGDSAGGAVGCRVTGYPGFIGERPGIGLDSRLTGALTNINAVKGVFIGDWLALMGLGSRFVDEIIGFDDSNLYTRTNNSGGILGGLSTGGSPIDLHVFFKPTSSIKKPVETVDINNDPAIIQLGEEDRHDPCVAIRGVEVVKGVVRTALLQAWLAENPR